MRCGPPPCRQIARGTLAHACTLRFMPMPMPTAALCCLYRMTVKLAVAGAFHTDFMQPAVGKLQEALAATTIVTPRIPVVSNVDAKPHSDPATIKEILSKQVGAQRSARPPAHPLARHAQALAR